MLCPMLRNDRIDSDRKEPTFIEDTLDVETVRGTCLEVGALVDLIAQLAHTRVIDDPRHPLRQTVLGADQDDGHVAQVAVVGQTLVVLQHCVETLLVVQAEHKHHGVHPQGELQGKGTLS